MTRNPKESLIRPQLPLPIHLLEHVVNLGKEVRDFRSLIVPFSVGINLGLGLFGEVLANLRDWEDNLQSQIMESNVIDIDNH